MARQLRIEYPGAVYHVVARGDRRRRIFIDDEDHEIFLRTLGQACGRAGFKVYAWVLMGNHYHLALSTPRGNLVEGMKWLQNAYTRRFNVKRRGRGAVFGDRYKSVPVDPDEAGGYLARLLEYIHLNPARARRVSAKRGESILDYPWSSIARCYALPPGKRPAWMAGGEGLSIMGFADTAKGRRELVAALDARIASGRVSKCGIPEIEGQGLQSTLRRGWFWGSPEFREKLLAMPATAKGGTKPAAGKKKPRKGNLGQAATEGAAKELLRRGLQHFGIANRAALRALGRGDTRRVAIAWALWRKTSVPQRWIAEAVGYNTAANVGQQARHYDSAKKKTKPERDWVRIVESS